MAALPDWLNPHALPAHLVITAEQDAYRLWHPLAKISAALSGDDLDALFRVLASRAENTAPVAVPAGEADGPAVYPDVRLKLRNNFALDVSSDAGFSIYSSARRSTLQISAADARLVLMFGTPRSVQEALHAGLPHQRLPLVTWLVGHGVLGPAAPHPEDARPDVAPHPVRDPRPDPPRHGIRRPARRGGSGGRKVPVYFVTDSDAHYPLSLGLLMAYAESYAGGALQQHYEFVPPLRFDTPDEYFAVYKEYGRGIWTFSNYLWSLASNLAVSSMIKRSFDAGSICVHGGPSTPAYDDHCRAFLKSHPHVDIAVRGEGEQVMIDLLTALADHDLSDKACFSDLGKIPGLTFSPDRENAASLQRTPDRDRIADLDVLPSPYLTGVFDDFGTAGRTCSIIETNRGCPYGCTFCDWGSATLTRIRQFSLERVKSEILWAARHGTHTIFIADANFGIFARDVVIAEYIGEVKREYGYPLEVAVNYPKNSHKHTTDIVKAFAEAGIASQGIISIQTTDPATLKIIRRDNISTPAYDQLMQLFEAQALPISVDLMLGLPGSTVESFKSDLQYYFDRDVSVKVYRTQLLPNSPLAAPDYVRRYAIQVDDRAYLVACTSYTRADLGEMEDLYRLFQVADGFGLLRYVMGYLQWDHGIPAVEYLHQLLKQISFRPEQCPDLTWMLREFVLQRKVLHGWPVFYDAVARFTRLQFGIADDPGLRTALLVNELMMPDEGRGFPHVQPLEHNFVAYWQEHHRRRSPCETRLTEYAAGSITIDDPHDYCHRTYGVMRDVPLHDLYDSHQKHWELRSPLARLRSRPGTYNAPARNYGSARGGETRMSAVSL